MVAFVASLPGASPGLGIDASTVTPRRTKKASAQALRDIRRVRFERRQTSRTWLLDEAREMILDPADLMHVVPRVAKCGWACAATVGVHKGANQARFSGVQSCASIWSCPTCSAVIRARRAEEVQHSADWWERQPDKSFLFVTFTARHFLEDSLYTSLSALTGAFTRLIRGAPWKRFSSRHGISHLIKSVEVTLSWRNGWHAHLHVLFFTDRHASKAGFNEARAWLSDRWAEMVVKCGGRRPSKSRGVDVRTVQDGNVVALYISKLQESEKPRNWRIGQEMTRIDAKKGRLDSLVPFDLLDLDGLDDDEKDRQRIFWIEYVETTRGRRATTWSRGLKDACGLDDIDDDDVLAEDAAETVQDDPACLIRNAEWRKVQNRPEILARILELVELGRVDEVAEYVAIVIPPRRT